MLYCPAIILSLGKNVDMQVEVIQDQIGDGLTSGPERLSNLPKVTQLVHGRGRIWILTIQLYSACLFLICYLLFCTTYSQCYSLMHEVEIDTHQKISGKFVNFSGIILPFWGILIIFFSMLLLWVYNLPPPKKSQKERNHRKTAGPFYNIMVI